MAKDKKVVFFSIADEKNMPYFEKMKASLLYWHPKAKVELMGGQELQNTLKQDPHFFYRSTPAIARELIKEYDVVIKIDADSVITGDISDLWINDYDIAVPNNSNPKEYKKYPVTVWNIHPLSYLNCGLVAMQSETFIDHWWRLCTSPHFNFYQFREQDLMNIMIFYGMYKAVFLDASKTFWGLASKGYWPQIELRDNKLFLPPQPDWNEVEKEIKVIHWAGGNEANKMNFNTSFQEPVAKWLNKITKEEI